MTERKQLGDTCSSVDGRMSVLLAASRVEARAKRFWDAKGAVVVHFELRWMLSSNVDEVAVQVFSSTLEQVSSALMRTVEMNLLVF